MRESVAATPQNSSILDARTPSFTYEQPAHSGIIRSEDAPDYLSLPLFFFPLSPFSFCTFSLDLGHHGSWERTAAHSKGAHLCMEYLLLFCLLFFCSSVLLLFCFGGFLLGISLVDFFGGHGFFFGTFKGTS